MFVFENDAFQNNENIKISLQVHYAFVQSIYKYPQTRAIVTHMYTTQFAFQSYGWSRLRDYLIITNVF